METAYFSETLVSPARPHGITAQETNIAISAHTHLVQLADLASFHRSVLLWYSPVSLSTRHTLPSAVVSCRMFCGEIASVMDR
jgi:hypothetical protein